MVAFRKKPPETPPDSPEADDGVKEMVEQMEAEVARAGEGIEAWEHKYDLLRSQYSALSQEWATQIGDLKKKLEALPKKEAGPEAFVQEAQDFLQGYRELMSAYDGEVAMMVMKAKHPDAQGVDLLDKEYIEEKHGEALKGLVEAYGKSEETLSPELEAKVKELAQELGLDEAQAKAQLREMCEQSTNLAAEGLRQEDERGFWKKTGKLALMTARGLGMGMVVSTGVTAGVAVTGLTGGTGLGLGLGITSLAMSGYRALDRILTNKISSRKYQKQIKTGLEAGSGDAVARVQATLRDRIRVRKFEELKSKEAGQEGKTRDMELEEIREDFIAKPKQTIEQYQDKLRKVLEKVNVELDAEQELKPEDREALEKRRQAIEVLMATDSALVLERELHQAQERAKEKPTSDKVKNVVKDVTFGSALGLASRLISQQSRWAAAGVGAVGGVALGGQMAELRLAEKEWYRQEGKLTGKGKAAKGVAMAVGALIMGGSSYLLGQKAEHKAEAEAQKPELGPDGQPLSQGQEKVDVAAQKPAEGATTGPLQPEKTGGVTPENPPPTAGETPKAGVLTAEFGNRDFQSLGMDEKYAKLEEFFKAGQAHRWEDEIRTPEGSSSHDSIWASTRSLLKAHAAELGITKEGPELDRWAETQTANLVKQLGLDEGGRTMDLVHNGDKVYVYEGADHKLYLRFEAASGQEAGYLPEAKVEKPVEHIEAAPPPPAPQEAVAPLSPGPEVVNAQTMEDKSLSPEARQKMEAEESYLERELERHNIMRLPGHGPRSEHLSLYLRHWAEAQGLSVVQADQFVDQIAGDDDKLSKEDFIKQGLYDKENHEIVTEKLNQAVEQFKAQHPAEARVETPPAGPTAEPAPAAETAEAQAERIKAENREIGARLMESFAGSTTPEDLELQMGILERTMPDGYNKEILGGFRLSPEFGAMADNLAQTGEFNDSALKEAVSKFQAEASGHYQALGTLEGQRAFVADLKGMHPGWQEFLYDSKSGEMVLIEKSQSGKIEVYAIEEDGLAVKQKIYQFARPDKWDFDPEGKNFGRDILKAIFKSGLEPITTLPGPEAAAGVQVADAPEPQPEPAEAVNPPAAEAPPPPTQPEAGPPPEAEKPPTEPPQPEAGPAPGVEAGNKTPGEQIAEKVLERAAANVGLKVDLKDGVNSPEDLELLRNAYLEVASKAAAGDEDAKRLLPHLDSLADKYIQANPEFFREQGTTSHLDLVPAEQIKHAAEAELAIRMAEGPEWLQEAKGKFNKDGFDWQGVKNNQTWTADGVEYTAKVMESRSPDLAKGKLDTIQAQGQTYPVADKVVMQENGVYKAVRIFARQ